MIIIDNIIGNEVLRKLANIEYKDPFQLFYNNRKTNLINYIEKMEKAKMRIQIRN